MAHRVASLAASALLALVGCSDGPTRGVDPFCATRPQLELCEDFDEGSLPGAFDTQRLSDGTLVRMEDEGVSPPFALEASVHGGKAQLEKTFAFFGPKLRAFTQLRIDAPGTGEVELLAVEAGAHHFGILGAADGSYAAIVRGPDGETRHPASAVLPLGVWTSVRINADVGTDQPGKLTIYFGEDAVVSAVPLPASIMDVPTLLVGLSASEASATRTARYDDVTFTRL